MREGLLVLPMSVTSRVDVGRLLREVEGLEQFLHQASIRQPGTSVKMPKTSRLLDEFIDNNKLNPLVEKDRLQMQTFLVSVRSKAPVLHMSFSADPSAVFVQKLTTWLRKEIHPLTLLQVGLQPSIGAGCILRTTNKHFDFSLRQRFLKKRDLLTAKLQQGVSTAAPASAVQPPATPVLEAPSLQQPVPTAPAPVQQATPAPAVPVAPSAESVDDLAKEVNAALAGLQAHMASAPAATPPKQEAS